MTTSQWIALQRAGRYLEAPSGTCNSQHTANCHYTRLLLSRSFHTTFPKLHPLSTYQGSPRRGRKTNVPPSPPFIFSGLPNLPGWHPVNNWETLGTSCPRIPPQYMKDMGKENCLSHPLPSFSMPMCPAVMYTPVPKHAHPHPGSYPVISTREDMGRQKSPSYITFLPCSSLSSLKLNSNTLSRYHF